jgi:hypothetical protein
MENIALIFKLDIKLILSRNYTIMILRIFVYQSFEFFHL